MIPIIQVELAHEKRAHFYRAKGIKFKGTTGVTDIIGGKKTRTLMGWAVKMALGVARNWLLSFGSTPALLEPDEIEKHLEEARREPNKRKTDAADKGKLFHGYIEAWIKTGTINPDSEFIECLDKLQYKLHEYGITITDSESPVVSLLHGIAGQIDALGDKNNQKGILDWKFSGHIYEEYALQVGGSYVQCAKETYGTDFTWAAIFRYDLAGKFWEVKFIKDMQKCLDGFLAAKKLQEVLEEELFTEV